MKNDTSLFRKNENAAGTSLSELLIAPQLVTSGGAEDHSHEARYLAKLLSSPQGFDLFRSVDNEIFLRRSEDCRCIGIISAEAREGRTSIAMLLAVLTAINGSPGRVLLIDATLGGNGPSRYFNLKQTGAGLRSFCYADKSFAECISPTMLGNLDIITDANSLSGAEKLSQDGFSRLLQEARQHYRLVVVDTPPANQNRDVYSIARLLDAVFLTVRYGYSRRERIQPLVKVLQENKVTMLGAILNRCVFPLAGSR